MSTERSQLLSVQECLDAPNSFADLYLPLISIKVPGAPVALAHLAIHAAEAMQAQVML